MAIIIDATVGGVNSNSYIDLATANQLLETEKSANVWNDATNPVSDDDKSSALITATRVLDSVYNWVGDIVDTEIGGQSLRWPRDNSYDQDGREYLSTSIPRPIQVATALLASQIVSDGYTGQISTATDIKVGSIELELNPSNFESAIPTYIRNEIDHLGTYTGPDSSTSGMMSIVKVIRS